MRSDDLWEESYDTPCAACGDVPCFCLYNGLPLCEDCEAEARDCERLKGHVGTQEGTGEDIYLSDPDLPL